MLGISKAPLPEKLLPETNISKAIDRGLSYLVSHQFPNGEFCTYYSPDDPMKEWCVPDSTVFPTSIIANTLLVLQERQEVKTIYSKTIPFLIYQRMRYGTWQHFTKWHKLFPVSPPDIDNTIFAYSFLKSQSTDSPDPSQLILANHNRNGVLYTWFAFRMEKNGNSQYWRLILRELKRPIKTLAFWQINDCRRNDVDLGVNLNVLSFLGKRKATEPIIEFISKQIIHKDVIKTDGWYRSPIILYYLFSRNAKHKIEAFINIYPLIIENILDHYKPAKGFNDTILETALAITSLINLSYRGVEIDEGISFLLKSQAENGEWARSIFFYSGPKQVVGWGSEELTTGFCLEALALYDKLMKHDSDS